MNDKELYSRGFIVEYILSCSEEEFEFFCATMKVIDVSKALKNILDNCCRNETQKV